jgi:OmcA/MtrC family decaheme c-type cytochrome
LQATTERGSSGRLTNHLDGTYQYRFATNVKLPDPEIAAQAASQGLDLRYLPKLTHRVAMQFANGPNPSNPVYDWVPASGAQNPNYHYDVVATANCNSCHGELALHGGGRSESRYCVTCHNPGSTDANSANSVDFKQMIHKIHRGADLPSVKAGGSYVIWGYRDTPHDYSTVKFPRDIRDCQVCHAGTATTDGQQTVTSQGDNWSQYASKAACGSCHDDVDFDSHYGGQATDNNCMSCHSRSGVAGTIANSHFDSASAAMDAFEARILSISNTAPGARPVITFSVVNPQQGDQPYDILNDPQWTDGFNSRLAVTLSWSTTDYSNTGNEGSNASSLSIDALTEAVANGDGTFRVTSPLAIPDGSVPPNIAATGSGAVAIEGHPSVAGTQVPLTNVVSFYSIDEANGQAVARRQVVALDNCLDCHGSLSLHGNNRTNNIDSCVTCHNPRNTDSVRRAQATTPATDGKAEESVDFKTMIHAIHAGSFREQPLQVVGFGGIVHEFDGNFPSRLGNCLLCHEGGSYSLPMPATVLASTINSGASVADPADDTVTTRATAVCSSCHDSSGAKAHMLANGGNFATSQAAIDAGLVIEQCQLCHAEGRTFPVSALHGLDNE